MIAQMWLLMAEECIANEFLRPELAGSNIADGPGRDDLSMLVWLGALKNHTSVAGLLLSAPIVCGVPKKCTW